MKSFPFSFTLLFLSLYYFTLTQGLECYICGYLEGPGSDAVKNFDGVHKSCKSGKKPDKDYLHTCGESDPDIWNDTVTNWSCGKLYYEGKLAPDQKTSKITLRMCIPTLSSFDGKCDTTTVEEIKNVLKEFGTNTTVIPPTWDKDSLTACSCNSDKCNPSSILRISHSLCLFSFTLVVFFKFVRLI